MMTDDEAQIRAEIGQFAHNFNWPPEPLDPDYAASEIISELEAAEDEWWSEVLADPEWRAIMEQELIESAQYENVRREVRRDERGA